MKLESRKLKYFKKRHISILLSIFSAPLALLGLALLCLGRSVLVSPPDSTPALTVQLPLAMPVRQQQETPSIPATLPGWDQSVVLTVSIDGKDREMTLEEYLWGVVAAEMPASFEQQALNAQACAARTYTVYKLLHPSSAHEADLCDDTGCCQAWMSREERMEKWGEQGEVLAAKITNALESTDGMAVCYEGMPLQAVFHAASAEATRSAEAVWGTDVPYLQSVASPEGVDVPNYYSVVEISSEEFSERLPECDLSLGVGKTTYDDAGLSERILIGGEDISTAKLRRLFSLRSASMTVELEDDTVRFYVTGYGHGVGMSQYGANELAKEGSGWQEILTHYYSNATIENLADKALDLG